MLSITLEGESEVRGRFSFRTAVRGLVPLVWWEGIERPEWSLAGDGVVSKPQPAVKGVERSGVGPRGAPAGLRAVSAANLLRGRPASTPCTA